VSSQPPKKQNRPLHGLLIIDKPGMAPLPAGACLYEAPDLPLDPQSNPYRSLHPTSHDIVQRVRRLSGTRRIGHTGTLDPMASGVLVLCLGWATRLVEYYQGHDKQYLAEITFGCETDTCDALGTVIAVAALPPLDEARIEQALAGFRGEIMQTPPIYSALKQGGESLHRKARRGEVVEIAARPITIHSLELVAIDPPNRIRVRVHSAAGAYMRSLARDLGKALGTRATLTGLRRESAGGFTLAVAHSMAEVESIAGSNLQTESGSDGLGSLLLAAGAGLDLPALIVEDDASEALGKGQIIALPGADMHATALQARDAQGNLLGILRQTTRPTTYPTPETLYQNAMHWKADKWFAHYAQEGE